MSRGFESLTGRRVHLIGVSSLEIADVAVHLSHLGHTDLVGHDLCAPEALSRSFRAAHIGMAPIDREAHWTALNAVDMPLRLGAEYLAGIDAGDAVIVSQAWRLYEANAPLHALAAGETPFVTPIELHLQLASDRGITTIGVTGSNGKSTTSNMAASILAAGGRAHLLSGNYRYRGPILGDLEKLDPDAVVILEISNHHLLALQRGVDVAVVTNVTPNHLEEHADFEAYTALKRRLIELLKPEGVAVLNADDPVSSRFSQATSSTIRWFSLEETTAPLPTLKVPGRHNQANALAAGLACEAVGTPAEVVREGLAAFPGAPGRLEHMRTVSDIRFYYDIESTTPESSIRAIEAFGDSRVHLIAGGDSKGLSYADLISRAKAAGTQVTLLEGSASDAIETSAREQGLGIRRAETLEEAVRGAYAAARPGAVVVLSPGARAFYNNHIRGGPSFRRLVKRLRRRSDST
jgi:UDP-N-acetylmuramoylalanine--D-glutamate ligase